MQRFLYGPPPQPAAPGGDTTPPRSWPTCWGTLIQDLRDREQLRDRGA